MTVERGRLWGSDQHVPADTPVVATDTDLARAHQQGHLLVALDGGDLWRTLGGRGGVTRRLGTSTWVMPVDLARVTLDGQAVKLTSLEYRLLAYLMHHESRVVSRSELVEHLYDQDFDRDSNTIEVFVGRLRKKLGTDYIKTSRGLGYCLSNPDDAS